ncbi:Transcriptional regulator, TetR family [Streptococcus gallolyticus]|uniref:Transcriptional regulator, TetR family n=3 Tax=Streptococcus gallolyticus TaxID=315405 RepID=A0A139N0G9_9STRE|nr:TetR/AcrR family transcriptional regulator [Streptococcus gallolyticus]KXT69518.1 Transcriptional regulator, TetR family [Streptococcus gallolyticus]
MNSYEDERILKSRQKIISSLLKLLEEKKFEEISIVSICQGAQVSRTTFYTHFTDKESVIQSFQADVSQEIFDSLQGSNTDIYHFIEQVVQIWDKHYQILKIIFSPNNQLYIDQETQVILENRLKNRILPLLSSDYETLENLDYLATFYAGAIYAVLKKWLTDDTRLSSEQLLEKFLNLFPRERFKNNKLQISLSKKIKE